MQDDALSTAEIIPKLIGGQIIEQISSLLQQRAIENNPLNIQPNRPIKIETAESCLSPTDSMSSTSPLLQSPASSGSTSARKRVGSNMEGELEFKKMKAECGYEWEEPEVSFRSSDLPKAPEVVTPDTQFMMVPGRLSLLTSTTKYRVTVGEISRRLGSPENLNASILGAILRRAKSKNGGKELRRCLEAFGTHLAAGKRKSTQVTLFTSMIEGECEQLAKDFDFLCNSEFPAAELAKHVVQQKVKQDAENVRKRKEELQTALKVMNELMVSMTTDSSEISVQNPMENFQLLTHNFGTSALLTAYGTFNKYITTQLDLLTPKLPIAPKPIYPVQQFPAGLDQNQANLLTLQALLEMCQQQNVI